MTLNQLIENLQRIKEQYPFTAEHPVTIKVRRSARKIDVVTDFSLSTWFPETENLAEVQIYCSIYKPKELEL